MKKTKKNNHNDFERFLILFSMHLYKIKFHLGKFMVRMTKFATFVNVVLFYNDLC